MPISAISSSTDDQHGRGYPRPQLRRPAWFSLNGTWEFAIDPDGVCRTSRRGRLGREHYGAVRAGGAASGIGRTGFFRACWYRQRCEVPPARRIDRWILHFGAVDWQATVWVNGVFVGKHEGGYTPFGFDITDLVCRRGLRNRGARRGRSARPGKAARQAGLAARAALDLVSAHDRHLADGLAREGAGHATSAGSRSRPNLARWEIGVEAWLEGQRARPACGSA